MSYPKMTTGTEAVTLSTISLAFAFFFTSLRCYSRFIIVRSFGVDDVLIVVAFFSSTAVTVFISEESRYGLGHDISTLTAPNVSNYLKMFWSSIICYVVGLTMVKNSALLQCLRFILLGKARIFCWCSLGFISIFGLASLFVNIFACTPVEAYWNRTLPDAKCINLTPYWFFSAAIIIATDILVVVIPIMTVKDMNLPRRQKAALIVVFALGGFVCACAIVRVHALVVLGKSPNFTRNNAGAAMWSSLELNVGIICVSIPPLKPVVLAVAPCLVRSKGHRDESPGSGLSGDTLTVHPRHQYKKQGSDVELMVINGTDTLHAHSHNQNYV